MFLDLDESFLEKKKGGMLTKEYFKNKHHVSLKEESVREIIQFLSSSINGFSSFSLEKKASAVFGQILASDLTNIGDSNVPASFHSRGEERHWNLEGQFLLQCNSWANILQSKNAREPMQKSMAKVCLTDGVTTLYGIEVSQIAGMKDLGWGAKILVKNVPVRRGLLMLDSSNTRVIGGSVESREELREKEKKRDAWEIWVENVQLGHLLSNGGHSIIPGYIESVEREAEVRAAPRREELVHQQNVNRPPLQTRMSEENSVEVYEQEMEDIEDIEDVIPQANSRFQPVNMNLVDKISPGKRKVEEVVIAPAVVTLDLAEESPVQKAKPIQQKKKKKFLDDEEESSASKVTTQLDEFDY